MQTWLTALEARIHSLYHYDFTNPSKCDNYKCFVKLLELKGINPNEWNKNSTQTAPFMCLTHKKPEYFRVLVDNIGI